MSTILLVADARWVVNDVAAALSDPTLRLVVEDDPRRAVEATRDHDPELVIVDLQVGSMGGMAVVRALRDAVQRGLVAERPIVLLLDRQADTFLARRAGADAWAVKPFTPQELRQAMAAARHPSADVASTVTEDADPDRAQEAPAGS